MMSLSCLRRPSEAEVGVAVETVTDCPAVELRPLEPGDRASVLEVFEGLSPRSRELRFLTAKPRLTAADLRQLTQVDQHHHVAILALHRGRPIAVGRFVRDDRDPQCADVAMAVVDAAQSRGVATMLAAALVRRAREVGVRRFTVMMVRDNEPALRLMQRASGDVEPLGIAADTAEFMLTLPDVEHDPDRAGARS